MRSGEPDRLAWLRSQGLGLACGFATVVLLAVGSVVLAATRDGASASVGMDDLRGFFAPPRLAHLWLYLLFPVTALYAVNTALATWDTVSRRWRAGVRAPTAYGASVVHLGFLVAILAHGVAGFFGADRGEVVLASGWRELPGFGEARLVSLDVEALPNGMPKEARARLELRARDGSTSEATVGYNAPLAGRGGSRLALLGELGRARVAHLASGAERCVLVEGEACEVSGERVRLLAARPLGGRAGGALLEVRAPSGAVEPRWLAADGELALGSGRPVQLERVATEPAVALHVREAPGTPWALAAGLVLVAGIALLWRKLVPRPGPARAAAAAARPDAPARGASATAGEPSP